MTLRNKPRLTYCGLTVILSNPSRFDRVSLLTATGGSLFNNHCLRPSNNVMQCDIRLCDDPSDLLPGTKVVLICGETAMHKLLPETTKNSIGEMRGSPFRYKGVVAIPSFSPQDAADICDHESKHNPLSPNYTPDDDSYSAPEDDDETDAKRHGRTSRSNYAFWLKKDTDKCKEVIRNGGAIPASEFPSPNYKIHANSEEVIQVLTQTKNKFLYFDIETDYEEQNLQCFAFSFDGATVYSLAILDHNYRPASSSYHRILRALAVALRDNTVVAHNGAAFDFFVLAYKYRIPVRRCYDTMIAQHRCFPDIEKSLGHCTSLWTWEKFHKDEDSHGYMSQQQMNDRLRYCAKDVFTMFLIHQAIIKHAKRIPGLQASIDTAMDTIVPYLVTSLQGIKYQAEKVQAISKENDRLMMQYIRMCNILIGVEGMKEVAQAVKGKAKAFPGSNKQCCEYFHNILGYQVEYRSPKTGEPGLGKMVLYRFALKHDNPVIKLVLLYREMQKSYGTLQFIPWKDDANNVYKMPKETLL